MSSVPLSVVICTFNRANLLERTLTSLAAQTIRESMEVVVVNNNSTDSTTQVLQKWCSSQIIRLIALNEPRQGYYALARNTGVARATGQVIAFVDDDVWIPPNWAAQLLRVFADRPDVDCLGGPVDAEWENPPPPSWINPELSFCVSVGHYGPVTKFLTGKEYPIGTNMAFRANVFSEIGVFDPRLGRIGADSLYCDEVEFIERLRARGKLVYYDPEVRITHFVPKIRAEKAYFLARRQADGRSIAIWEGLRSGKRLVARNAFLRLVLTVTRDIPGYTLTLIGLRDRHFTYVCRLVKTSSYLKQAMQIVMRGIDGAL